MKKIICILMCMLVLFGCSLGKPLNTTYDIKENINVDTRVDCVEKKSGTKGYEGSYYLDGCARYSDTAKISHIGFDWSIEDFSTLAKLEKTAIQSGDESKVKKYDNYNKELLDFYSEIECVSESEYVQVDNGSIHFDCTYNKKYAKDLGIKVINTSFDLSSSEMNHSYSSWFLESLN